MADSATKMETVNLRLPASEVRMAEKRAAELGLTKSDIFRMVWRGVMPTRCRSTRSADEEPRHPRAGMAAGVGFS